MKVWHTVCSILGTAKKKAVNRVKMEETVQHFINSQPHGVKLAEMEESLRQSRLRLGYVTRKLLNEGKVIKVENKYFPIAESVEKY